MKKKNQQDNGDDLPVKVRLRSNEQSFQDTGNSVYPLLTFLIAQENRLTPPEWVLTWIYEGFKKYYESLGKADGFVFHDLRHTFNTFMRKAGVQESVIMEITGHSTREMFDRYNTVDTEDRKQAMKVFESFLQSKSESVDQSVDQEAISGK